MQIVLSAGFRYKLHFLHGNSGARIRASTNSFRELHVLQSVLERGQFYLLAAADSVHKFLFHPPAARKLGPDKNFLQSGFTALPAKQLLTGNVIMQSPLTAVNPDFR